MGQNAEWRGGRVRQAVPTDQDDTTQATGTEHAEATASSTEVETPADDGLERPEESPRRSLDGTLMTLRDAIAELDMRDRLTTLRDGATERGQRAWRWVRGLSGESWVWIAIITLAAVLRFWGVGDKPLHHDESMHAYFSLVFARDPSSYWYDPLLHGPFQFHAEGIIFAVIIALSQVFHVATAAGNPWINDTTARLLPATTGVVLVALTYGLRRPLGRIGAPIAAFLLAVSPAFVYFSRFLREDIYFACFTYATVVCAVQFAQKRTMRWLLATAASFILAYATKEAIYLNVAIWGSFLAIVAVWEVGDLISARLPAILSERERAFFGHAAPLMLLGAIGSAIAGLGLHQLGVLSQYINAHPDQTQAQVQQLENTTVSVLLYGSILVAVVVIGVLMKQIYFDMNPSSSGASAHASAAEDADEGASAWDDENEGEPEPRARGWLARIAGAFDPERQPFVRMVLSISWVSWFITFVVGWVLFAALYWVVPGADHAKNIAQGFQVGVGRGIWQGLYYWIQQQQVARGGQPWYYYLLLIPLYEQVAVVFGVAGIIRCIARPTRFRLFLVYWFGVSLVLYSWAGEKMPWLSIHILLPLMLLAALALEWLIAEALALVRHFKGGLAMDAVDETEEREDETLAPRNRWQEALAALTSVRARATGVALGLLVAVMLLVPTLYGMLVLSHPDAANGPHEMMVYVQTTPDVQLVMDKLDRADQQMYRGQHQLKIAIGQGEEWPFYWYLRNYWMDPHPSTYVYWDYPVNTTATPTEDALILTPEDASTFMQQHAGYTSREYQLRSWWDEGYKPPPCVPTAKNPCPASASWGAGVGPGLWLSYGDTPPPHAKFDLGLAASRLWAWLWQRKPLGYDHGSYDFVLVVRKGVPIQP